VKRWSVRSSRLTWLVVVGTAALGVGCQDGYPIAPTRCDYLCQQTARECVSVSNPAMCVESCESAGVGLAACAELTEQLTACLKAKSDTELDCEHLLSASVAPCSAEQESAYACGADGNRNRTN
jgi:hypothetical protein